MILHGSIARFGLADVLQFLARSRATGVLQIRDHEEEGAVYLVKGRVEAVSLPMTDERLGVHLLRSGALSEEQLARALMDDPQAAGSPARRALGERLVEKGFVQEETVRQAMHRLTVDRIFEVIHWRSGIFTYDEPPDMPLFRIAIQKDVEELLLVAQQRIDEGHRPQKRVARPVPDACRGCIATDCTPQIRATYLRNDACLWRKMSAVVSEPQLQADGRDPSSLSAKDRLAAVTRTGRDSALEACVTTTRDPAPVQRRAYSF